MRESDFLTVNLEDNGGVLTFKKPINFKEWADRERSAWMWLNNVANSDGNIQGIINSGQIYARDNIHNLAHNYENNPGLINNINDIFNNYYKTSRAIISESPQGKFILKLSEENPSIGAWALAAATATNGHMLPMSSVSRQAMDGILRFSLFRLGIKGTAIAEKKALDDLFNISSARMNELNEIKLDHGAKILALELQQQELLQTLNTSVNETLSVFRQQHEAAQANALSNLAAIESTYDDKLALQAPVTYWSDKAKMHLRNVKWLAGALAGLMTASIFGTYKTMRVILPSITPGQFPDPWRLGLILILVTMSIWIIRITVKVLLSQLHLHTDAEERTVLTNAYLSLLRRDQAVKDQDRELILQLLFRSAATGIVDDSGPSTPLEIFSRVASGK